MSQSSQPQAHGWLQHKPTIEKLLIGAKERNILSALYLYGPPTSGLNSSLVDFVVQQVEGGLAPKQVVYIAGTDLDREYVASRPKVVALKGENYQTDKFLIKSAQEFCDDFEAGNVAFRDSLLLMLEVRMSATVAEEVMFGVILDYLRKIAHARKDGNVFHVAVLLLGSSWFSDRTFKSFEKLMQTRKRSILDNRPFANFSNPNPEALNQMLGQALNQRQRILFSNFYDWNPFRTYSQINAYRNNGEQLDIPRLPTQGSVRHVSSDVRDIRDALCFQVDPQSLFSTSTTLSLVVSSDSTTSKVLDSFTSQVVQVERRLTRCEVENALAWAQNATTPAQILANYALGTLASLKDGDECLGPAWSTHLVPLVLQTINLMGHDGNRPIRDYPIRIPANHVAWADRCRRLTVLGCLKENTDKRGAYFVTRRGKIMAELTTKRDLDWEVAWLLMSALDDERLDATSRRILAYMAAILACGPSRFIAKVGTLKANGEPYTTADLKNLCAPIVASHASHGMLWLYTGILLRCLDAPFETTAETKTIYPDSYIVIVPDQISDIQDLFQNKFLPICNLQPAQNTGWKNTPLTAEQASRISSVLTWAFLHRSVYFENEMRDSEIRGLPDHMYLAKDCVSLSDVQVDQGEEFLDVEQWVDFGNKNTEGGGFYAIYTQLVRVGEGSYIAKDLTRVPSTTFQEIEKEVGIPWPELVLRILS